MVARVQQVGRRRDNGPPRGTGEWAPRRAAHPTRAASRSLTSPGNRKGVGMAVYFDCDYCGTEIFREQVRADLERRGALVEKADG